MMYELLKFGLVAALCCVLVLGVGGETEFGPATVGGVRITPPWNDVFGDAAAGPPPTLEAQNSKEVVVKHVHDFKGMYPFIVINKFQDRVAVVSPVDGAAVQPATNVEDDSEVVTQTFYYRHVGEDGQLVPMKRVSIRQDGTEDFEWKFTLLKSRDEWYFLWSPLYFSEPKANPEWRLLLNESFPVNARAFPEDIFEAIHTIPDITDDYFVVTVSLRKDEMHRKPVPCIGGFDEQALNIWMKRWLVQYERSLPVYRKLLGSTYTMPNGVMPFVVINFMQEVRMTATDRLMAATMYLNENTLKGVTYGYDVTGAAEPGTETVVKDFKKWNKKLHKKKKSALSCTVEQRPEIDVPKYKCDKYGGVTPVDVAVWRDRDATYTYVEIAVLCLKNGDDGKCYIYHNKQFTSSKKFKKLVGERVAYILLRWTYHLRKQSTMHLLRYAVDAVPPHMEEYGVERKFINTQAMQTGSPSPTVTHSERRTSTRSVHHSNSPNSSRPESVSSVHSDRYYSAKSGISGKPEAT